MRAPNTTGAKLRHRALFLFAATLIQACGVKYGFTGGSIPEGTKTYTVEFFENTAPIVNPTLSLSFTEALKERIRNQSSLSQVDNDGDAIFEGRITGYSIAPAAVEAGTDRAALNRLSITVNVKYTNNKKPEDNFEQAFTRFKDFSSAGGSIPAQEEALIRDINQMLTEDIFNRAFANW
ncbi:Lipopolysaccharide-assembly [Parapedobacter luteus]|uniref:Lipopolysaccharide-assembly n=1 Tax=Parapedobacter luteus TaxID=623280 RepID=A0A1T5EPM3_9SPHI|nr:LptE family protein [Parapedobacter luteus]SKB85610.1 Lipopolysaccharide-assembly [Parapedobacter luteus]